MSHNLHTTTKLAEPALLNNGVARNFRFPEMLADPHKTFILSKSLNHKFLVDHLFLNNQKIKKMLDATPLTITMKYFSYGPPLLDAMRPQRADHKNKNSKTPNKLLRIITAVSWYVKSSNIHKDLYVPLVIIIITKYTAKQLKRLYPYPIAEFIISNGG